ncbi:MAG: oxidoreductase, partial [Actinomycetota bacterium]|nr:oxidoreductase [Actinomycetota bacterium]
MTTSTRPSSAVAPAGGGPRPPRPLAALSGLLGAAVALGVGEFLAGLWQGAPSLVVAVGGRVVDLVPGAVERLAIAVLGTADKPALLVGVCVLSAVFGAALGVAAGRRFVVGAAGFAAFAAL